MVLVLIEIARNESGGVVDWSSFLGRLLVIGPLAGAFVGAAGAWLMAAADRRFAIRREYQALYGIGLVLAAYYLGAVLGGDGFLSAFVAGAAVTVFNFELCDCFLDFGEVVAEATMLFAFVLFGAVLADMFDLIALGPALIFGVLVIGVSRPVAFGVVLRKANLSGSARGFIAWFGPRGLASLLLALLVVEAGVGWGETMLVTVGVVVVLSVVAHGVTATPLTSRYADRVAHETLAEERVGTASGLFRRKSAGVSRVTTKELFDRLNSPNPDDQPLVLDVRTRSQYAQSTVQIPGSIRVLPDDVAEWAAHASRERPLVAYCT